MTDAWLAEVISFDPLTKEAVALPKITEPDGTPHPEITVKAVAGITPEPGDLVLVITLRNNLDDAYISRFFEASETNGRIVDVVKSVQGVFKFTGNYKFTGQFAIDGSLDVTGPVSVDGSLDVTGPATLKNGATITGDASVSGNLSVGANLSVSGSATVSGSASFTAAATFNGSATFNDSMTANSLVTLGGILFATHRHTCPPLGGDSGPPHN